jgi:hypothetical protein
MAAETFRSATTAPRPGLTRRLERTLGRDWVAAWAFFAPTFLLLFVLVGWPFA